MRRPPAAAAQRAPARDDGRLGLRVWLRLLTTGNLVVERLRRGLREEFDVTLPAFDLLAQARRPPAGPTMSELSRRLMVTKGNVSDLAARLEKDGLVERRADARDGRVQRVHLTPAGEALLARMQPRHRAWLDELMAGVDEARLALLHGALGELKESVLAAAAPRDAGRRARAPRRTTLPPGRRRDEEGRR